MASTIMIRNLVVTAVLAAVFCGGAMAQSSSCSSALISLSPCLNFISGNSSSPSSSCCSQLSSVVGSEPQCLCQVVNGNAASSLGITVNKTLALELPSKCGVKTQSVSACNAAPSGSPTTTTSTSSGSKTVPSTPTTTTTSDGSNIKTQFSLFFFLGFLALSGSSIFGF